ncbi:4'-phosphopantetheinyl transferase superfamily protein [Patescibacteria group bacterium]|nr:4'-phosphopantetheinyl transferase superfamily protein [Patescibacteria group bacterium]
MSIHKIYSQLGDSDFMDKTFHDFEKHPIDARRLSTIYALKECVFKAIDISDRDWLDIKVLFSARGKPRITLCSNISPLGLESVDCSVSHENGYILANVVLLIQ